MPDGKFIGSYELIRYPTWPVGIFEYQPYIGDALVYVRPDGRWIVLNQSFQTDLASTPRILWPIYGLAPGDMERPALVHDWLYTIHHRDQDLYGFRESNLILQEACRTEGYSKPMAWAIRKGCDWFGGPIWNRPTPKVVYSHPHNVPAENVSARESPWSKKP